MRCGVVFWSVLVVIAMACQQEQAGKAKGDDNPRIQNDTLSYTYKAYRLDGATQEVKDNGAVELKQSVGKEKMCIVTRFGYTENSRGVMKLSDVTIKPLHSNCSKLDAKSKEEAPTGYHIPLVEDQGQPWYLQG